MPVIYLALGSNLGERAANLQHAIARLAPQVTVRKSSQVYQTPPWGYTDQPVFLNQVVCGFTRLGAPDVLVHLKTIEAALGRQATFRDGPRIVDLDILYYGRQVIDLPKLHIPHPRLAERAFVLVPLAELAPNLRHPVTGLTSLEMLAQVDTAGIFAYTGG